jgi:hypothetical protein
MSSFSIWDNRGEGEEPTLIKILKKIKERKAPESFWIFRGQK